MTDPRLPIKNRLSTRLALLFFGTFLGTLMLLVAWTMISTIADRRQVAAGSETASPVIVIDPKIKTDLTKALAFDALPASGEVLNPFLDRAGLSGTVAATTLRASTQTSSSSPGATSTTTVTSSGARVPSNRSAGSPMFQEPSSVDTYSVKARHEDWLERQKRGEFVGPESEILVVEDLVPVGFASGGDRAAEVMLLSVSLCQTFSFPAGTRFANGWLSGFDASEVVFTFQDGIRRKSYSNNEGCRSSDARSAN